MPQPKTPEAVVSECNKLAILFYKSCGCRVSSDYKMYDASHPQEAGMWNLAVIAYDFIEGIDVMQALDEFDNKEE